MQRCKSSEQARDFLSAQSFIHGHSRLRRHQLAAHTYRTIRSEAFKTWHQETCAQFRVVPLRLDQRVKFAETQLNWPVSLGGLISRKDDWSGYGYLSTLRVLLEALCFSEDAMDPTGDDRIQ